MSTEPMAVTCLPASLRASSGQVTKLWATELLEALRAMSMFTVLKVGQDTPKNKSSFKFKPIRNDESEVFLQ